MKRSELFGIIFFVLVWEVFAQVFRNYFFPSLSFIFSDVVLKVSGDLIYQNIFSTVIKTIVGFLIGGILGTLVGSIIATRAELVRFSAFVIDFMRSLPSISVFPLFMIVFGVNDFTKIMVVAFGIFWIIFFSTIQSIQTISATKVRYLKIHGASSWEIFRHYIVFVLIRNWLSMVKITLNLSLFTTIVLEMFIGSEYGIGKALIDAKNYYEIPVMYFWIIVAGLVGYGLNKIVSLVEGQFQ
jgi:ABC-type nitrate/sulfonate/bicarbonate transport system permease component